MVTLKTKSALSYFGSDSEVAPALAAMLDHCSHVTIPFVGGASILPHLTARAIVANDKNDLAINFYRVMSNTESTRDRLIAMCESTLSHPSEITKAAHILATPNVGAVPKAWAYWAQCWIGRKGKGGTGSPATMPSVRRTASGGTNASRIRAAASDLLPKVADNRECGVYCDPPWIGAGDAYLHTFSDQDHIDLAECLSRFQAATVVVRYGDHPMVRRYYREMGWRIIEAESRDQSNAVTREVWITNQRGD